jgi:periplasmic protein TonB
MSKGFWEKITGPRTQASLFHYIKEEPEESVWSQLDFSVLRHPIRFLKEEWNQPHTQPSLFKYIVEDQHEHLSFKELVTDLVRGSDPTTFVHSLYLDSTIEFEEVARVKSRKNKARVFSIVTHVFLVLLAFVLIGRHEEVAAVEPAETVVFLNSPVTLPWDLGPSTGEGGGGGGGGKREPTPPSGGRMAETSPVQLVPPDPADPQPLMPAEDILQEAATVVMPIEIPQDETLPIGDLAAPLSDRRSSGPGSGGGIGVGTGTGIGPGTGPGVGPGSGGGMGGGSGGGIGSGHGPGIGPYRVGGGVREPVLIYKTLPGYTEEARKNRVEGIVLLEVVVRANGSVDNAKVVRGLGFGLDESALREVVTKWKFKPGTLEGRPVDVQALIEVSFRLL